MISKLAASVAIIAIVIGAVLLVLNLWGAVNLDVVGWKIWWTLGIVAFAAGLVSLIAGAAA